MAAYDVTVRQQISIGGIEHARAVSECFAVAPMRSDVRDSRTNAIIGVRHDFRIGIERSQLMRARLQHFNIVARQRAIDSWSFGRVSRLETAKAVSSRD